MASKNDNNRAREWTQDELGLFAQILASEDNGFCRALEELALKKSSNNEIYDHIKRLFDTARKKQEFVDRNMKNFGGKKKTKYTALDTSITKLRRKYSNLKTLWRKITDKAKNGSGLAAEQEYEWYQYLNPIFSETNADLQLSSGSQDLSFGGENDVDVENDSLDESNSSSEDSGSEQSEREDNVDDEHSDNFSENNENDQNPQNDAQRGKKGKDKTVIKPHRKRKRIRSQVEASSMMAESMRRFADSHDKRWKQSLREEKKRDEMFLNFKREEAEKDRKHELEMAKIFAAAFTKSSDTPSTSQTISREAYVTPQRHSVEEYPYTQRRYTNDGGKLYENLDMIRSPNY